MKIELLVLDVDRTITDPEGKISEENIMAVRGFLEKGVKVALATGRTEHGVTRIKEELGLGDNTPLILANGALVLSGDKILVEDFMVPDDVKLINEHASSTAKVVISVFNPDKGIYWVPPELDKNWAKERFTPFDLTWIEEVEEVDMLPTDQVSKIMLMADQAREAQKVYDLWPEDLDHIQRSNSSELVCEINQTGVTKGTGLALLCEKIAIPPSQVLAMGDGGTDIPLFETAKYGVFIKRDAMALDIPEHVVTAPEEDKDTAISWVLDNLDKIINKSM